MYKRQDLDPAAAWLKTLPLRGHRFEDLTVYLLSAEGKTLVSYKPCRRGQKKPVEVRQPVRRPAEYATVEDVYKRQGY